MVCSFFFIPTLQNIFLKVCVTLLRKKKNCTCFRSRISNNVCRNILLYYFQRRVEKLTQYELWSRIMKFSTKCHMIYSLKEKELGCKLGCLNEFILYLSSLFKLLDCHCFRSKRLFRLGYLECHLFSVENTNWFHFKILLILKFKIYFEKALRSPWTHFWIFFSLSQRIQPVNS